ncbi:MAG: hypothetical protein ACK5KP_02110 [Paludibacteraceae bacterium]
MLNIQNIPSGIYILRVIDKEKKINTAKILISHSI